MVEAFGILIVGIILFFLVLMGLAGAFVILGLMASVLLAPVVFIARLIRGTVS